MRQFIREALDAAALFIVVFAALYFSVQNIRIDGMSMYPTVISEQHIIVSKLAYVGLNPAALKRFVPFVERSEAQGSLIVSQLPDYGDMIAFLYPEDPSREFVKRVIGLPGDYIEIDRGQVIRNGEPLDEPYVVNADTRSFERTWVPPNSIYVLGDNRPVSSDSRSWGAVKDQFIIGRTWLSYWPSERIAFPHGPW
ncbi:MAG: signal peptidase I [Dehalococcoidia bacterium]|nr:signal peptidase I [Dehalococcoidia bacterium]